MDIKKIFSLIKFDQTLLFLPLAYVGILFAEGDDISIYLWVTLAYIAGRTAGIVFNRAIDFDIDKRKHSFMGRHYKSGDLSPGVLYTIGVILSMLFVFCAYMLNDLCFYLSFGVVVLLYTHSYFKRITWGTHVFMGLVEASAPIGGYIAETARFEMTAFILGAGVFFWITALDIFYSIQDVDFDSDENLYSIPQRFGIDKGRAMFMLFNILAVSAFIVAGVLETRGVPFWGSLICVFIVLIRESILSKKRDMQLALKEFIQLNYLITPLIFVGTLLDVLTKH